MFFFHSSTSQQQQQEKDAEGTLGNLLFTALPDQKRIIEHGLETFRALQHNEQDCFRNAALALQAGCRSLTVSRQDKVQYALMLTWCELSTANVPIPPACVPPLSSHEKAQQCVILLASVPQTWTSYSGYYRDAESMCLAIRYPIERELIEQLHRNVTRQQLSNLLLLKEHHQEVTKWRQQEIASLVDITHIQQQLWDEWQMNIKTMHGQTKQDLSEITSLIVAVRDQLQRKQEEQMAYLDVIDVSYQEALAVFMHTTEQDLGMIIGQVEKRLGHLNTGMDLALVQQRKSAAELHTLQASQTATVAQWQTMVYDMNSSLSNLLVSTAHGLQYLRNDIHTVHQQFQDILGPLSRMWAVLITVLGLSMLLLVLSHRASIILMALVILLIPDWRIRAIVLLFLLVTFLKTKFKYYPYVHIAQASSRTPSLTTQRMHLYHDLIK